MRDKPRLSRPSPAMVVAMLALFVAFGSATYAASKIGSSQIKRGAVKSKQIKDGQVKNVDLADGSVSNAKLGADAVTSNKVLDGELTGNDIANGAISNAKLGADAVTSNKVLNDSLTGNDINESSLAQVPSANTATTATTASNAINLGGFPASAYQRFCQPGAIAAHVYVKGSATFSATYTSADPPLQNQFNCSGSATKVQVKRTATGTYFVDFPGIDVGNRLVATGNVTVDAAGTQDNNNIVTYKLVFDATIGRTVYRVETANGGGTLQDREFSFSVDA